MSRLICIFGLVVFLSLLCQGQEEKNVTLPKDKMTIDKAWEALLEKEEGELTFGLLFSNLPDEPDPEIIDTKLTYQKARAALMAESRELKRFTALVVEKRRILAKMIGSQGKVLENGEWVWVPNPPYTRKQYDEAKASYEKARDKLLKIRALGDKRVLFEKAPKK